MTTKRILVIRLGSLGDVILTAAPVLNLKIAYPDSEITFLTRRKYADMVRLFDGVDQVKEVPDDVTATAYLHLLSQLDRGYFEGIIDLHGNLRSWLARKYLSADRTVVYPKRRLERRRIVKHHFRPAAWPHTIDLYNRAVEEFGAVAHSRRPLVSLRENRLPLAKENERSIVIAPGAAHATKQWGLECFRRTADILCQDLDVHAQWVVTSGDEAQARKLFADKPNQQFLVDRSLVELIDVVARATVVIANDSGIAHLASAVGTPVVAVFGPTHPSLGFAPRGLFDTVVEVDEYCRPCSLHGEKSCYRDKTYCLERIEPEDVATIAGRLIEQQEQCSPALFVDRDGTIIHDKHYLSDPDQVELIPGAAPALRRASEAGYKLVIVSNQSGIAYGYHSIEDAQRVNARVQELLEPHHVQVAGVYFCPHHVSGRPDSPYAIRCDCRKPSAGMAETAACQLNLDLRHSAVVGDSIVDYNLGRVIGARSWLVRTGHGSRMETKFLADQVGPAEHVVGDLAAAVERILDVKDDNRSGILRTDRR